MDPSEAGSFSACDSSGEVSPSGMPRLRIFPKPKDFGGSGCGFKADELPGDGACMIPRDLGGKGCGLRAVLSTGEEGLAFPNDRIGGGEELLAGGVWGVEP